MSMTILRTSNGNARGFDGLLDQAEEARTARNGHNGHGQGSEAVPADDLGELIDVAVAIVELGTGDDELFPFQELPVETAQGEGRAIGGDEHVGALEIRRQGRDELELDGPLT